MTSTKPTLLVVRDTLGLPSEQWVPRQAAVFGELAPRFAGAAVHEGPAAWRCDEPVMLPFATMLEAASPAARLLNRLRGLIDGDPFSRRGRDRDALTRAVADARPSAILAHFGYAGLQLLPVARGLGIPITVHFHGFDVWSMALRNRWYGKAIRRRLRLFDDVVVVGSHQERWASERGVERDRLHRIPCGVPTAEFVPRSTPRMPGPTRFLAVGRLHACKGLDIALRALAAARKDGAEATLHLIGDGEERGRLKMLAAELGLTRVVTFAGAQPIGAVRLKLDEADVFVQHSLRLPDGSYEGFGVAVAEASACGLPVLVSDCGGLLDQVRDGETGLVTPQRDVGAMAAAIAELSRDTALRARLGAAGRQRVVEHYDARDQARKLEAVILNRLG
jgi:glycosyltransferase involved in cell wall biosynthesis